MADLTGRLADLSKTVYGMYRRETDPGRREEYKKRYEQLSHLLEQAAALNFEAHDPACREAADQLKTAKKKLKKIRRKIPKGPENFALFIELVENIDKLLTGIFPKFRKN